MKNIEPPQDNFTLKTIPTKKIVLWFEPFELGVLLKQEDYTTYTDIKMYAFLENMLEYFVEEELFEYACVVRDEIDYRKKIAVRK